MSAQGISAGVGYVKIRARVRRCFLVMRLWYHVLILLLPQSREMATDISDDGTSHGANPSRHVQ
jgi:hypothetical protein